MFSMFVRYNIRLLVAYKKPLRSHLIAQLDCIIISKTLVALPNTHYNVFRMMTFDLVITSLSSRLLRLWRGSRPRRPRLRDRGPLRRRWGSKTETPWIGGKLREKTSSSRRSPISTPRSPPQQQLHKGWDDGGGGGGEGRMVC